MNHTRSYTHIALGLLALSLAIIPTVVYGDDGKKPSKAALEQYDKDGDGKLSPEEEAARKADIAAKARKTREDNVAKYDKDGDGKLSKEEREAKKAEEEAERAAQKAQKQAEREAKKAAK